MFLGLLLALGSPTVAGRPIQVAGDRVWTDTSIDLVAGTTVGVRADGVIRIDGSDPGKSPQGDPGCIASIAFEAPGLHCWALIGRVGEEPPVEVGAAGSVTSARGGRLYLGINDDFAADNTGAWPADVWVSRDYGAEIAQQAASYRVGAYGGPARAWAALVVDEVLARYGTRRIGGPGGAYWGAYVNAGGVRVPAAEAAPGDLIQLTDPAGRYGDAFAPGMHTAIVVATTSVPGTFTVRDSNRDTRRKKIGEHEWTPAATGLEVSYWRFGPIR